MALTEIWRTRLGLCGPTNVVVGRLDGEPRLCVVGTRRDGDRESAAVEMRDGGGRLLWTDCRGVPGGDCGSGAYVHWVAGSGRMEPMILYSFAPRSATELGGGRLLRAADGGAVAEISNTTQFGNNNSIVADLDGDGRPELVYADQRTLTCVELPTRRQRWRVSDGVLFCWGLPALCDLDDDGLPEIVFGSEYNNPNGTSSMIAIDRNGRQLWRSDGHAEDLGSTPVVVADVDGDGRPELLKVGLDLEHCGNQRWNHLHIFGRDGTLRLTTELGFTGIAVGDVDGDGHTEGIGLSNTRDGGHNGLRQIRCLDLTTGAAKWACDVDRAYLDTNSPVMADVDGDGRPEAVVGTGNPAGYGRLPDSDPWGDLYVVSDAGRVQQRIQLPGWPVNLACCDVNDDGLEELLVVINGRPGWLALYQTQAPSRRNDWPTAFGSPARDGTVAEA